MANHISSKLYARHWPLLWLAVGVYAASNYAWLWLCVAGWLVVAVLWYTGKLR